MTAIAIAVMASQPGLVSFPAATKPGAGRTRASMNAHPARASAPQVRTRNKSPSNDAMAPAYASQGDESGSSRHHRTGAPRTEGQNATGHRSARGSSGALVDETSGRQFFLAGTTVGSAGLALRARVTPAEVTLAGAFVAAGLLFLATGAVLTAGFGASTASSAVALVASAASSTFSSALA